MSDFLEKKINNRNIPSNPERERNDTINDWVSWLVVWLYWIGTIILLYVLLINPIWGLLFWNNELPWVITTVIEYTKDEIELGFSEIITSVFFTLIAIILIPWVIYMPSKSLRSPLHFASMQVLKGLNDLILNENIKNDIDEMKNIWFKIGIYSLVLIWIFVMYFFLIDGIVSVIINNGWSIELIWLMVMIAVIAGWNSWLVNFLDSNDPMFDFKRNKFVKPANYKANSDSGKRIGLWLLFMVVNIIFLGVATAFSSYVIEKYDNSSIYGIIEGQASSIEELNLFAD